MSIMIFVCRQTAVKGHDLSSDYNCLNYCNDCPDTDDCNASPWIYNSSEEEK